HAPGGRAHFRAMGSNCLAEVRTIVDRPWPLRKGHAASDHSTLQVTMRKFRIPTVALATAIAATVLASPSAAQRITVERIFASNDFRLQGLAPRKWLSDGARYAIVERNPRTGATDLWIEDARSGERTLLIDGKTLVPPGAREPIAIEDFDFSADETKVLIFTNTQRVWRQNTKGTYYVYDVATKRLTPVSTRPGWQMFAKFSPD